MNKFILGALMLAATSAYAADVTVLEVDLPVMRTGRTTVDARFQMDSDTKEGFVKVTVTEEDMVYQRPIGPCHDGGYGGYPGGYPGGYYGGRRGYNYPMRHCYPVATPVYYNIFSETVKVENLIMIDNKVIYQGADGEVDCGTMGTSRILRVPTLFLSGKCELSGRIMRQRNGSKLVVTLKTK